MPACLPPLRHTAAPASPCFPSFPFSAVMPVVCTLPHGACLPDESPFPLRTLCSPYGVQGVGISFYHSDSATLSTLRTNSPLFSRTQKLGEKRKRKMFTNITLSGATQQCRATHRPVRSTPPCAPPSVQDGWRLPCMMQAFSLVHGAKPLVKTEGRGSGEHTHGHGTHVPAAPPHARVPLAAPRHTQRV